MPADSGLGMDGIDRRTSLLVLSSALFADSTKAFGQAFVKYMGEDISNALQLTQLVVGAPLDDKLDQYMIKFVTESFILRKRSVIGAMSSNVFQDAEKAIADLKLSAGAVVQGNREYVITEDDINSQIAVINFVASAEVPLVPNLSDILPIGIPVADPIKEKNEDTDFTVILDIALQTIGIVDGRELVDEALKDKDVSGLLQIVIPSIKSGDWQKLVELSERLFKLLIAAKFFENYAKKVGKRVAFRLGLRCVPILGWVYVVGAFILALKANYHRFSFA
jgi:hypothetical protein